MTKKLLMAAMAAVMLFAMTGCYSKPQSGEIGVVRNGGPFDNHSIRQIIPNGSGNTWNGWWSSSHYYPVYTQQRFFRFATCGSNDDGSSKACSGADAPAITVPTSDGVDVLIEGTFYLNTVFGNSQLDSPTASCAKEDGGGKGDCILKKFDTQFATRTFNGTHAYEGTDGWENFLGAIVEPIVINNLRQTISGTACADLVSSCALVQNQGQQGTQQVIQKSQGKTNQNHVQQVQDAVQSGLSADLKGTLGEDYFTNIKFNLQRVVLPAKIQGAIDSAQSAFADVSQAAARVRSAVLDSKANGERQAGYRKCPTCARIDAIKALPRGLTALGGNGFAVGVK